MDKDIKKISKSGITISGDIPLEEWVREQEAKEQAERLTEKVSEHHSIYRPIKPKYLNSKGKSGHIRDFTQREINYENWRRMDMKTIDQAIIATLLTGQERSGTEIKEYVKKNIPQTKSQDYYSRMSHLVNKTDLGKLIEKKQYGSGLKYKLVSAALDLTPEELHLFIYKDYAKRDEVLSRHKGLTPYLEKKEPPTQEIAQTTKLQDSVEKILSQELGVNIRISGNINVRFTFGLDRPL